MRFLRLHSDMEGFSIEKGVLRWETPHLELDSQGKFAVSTLVLSTSHGPGGNPVPIIVSSNLVENDLHNTDGIVTILPPGQFSFQAMTLEFWKLDSSRPRSVMFTLRGLDITSLEFISIVIAFE